MSRIWRTVGVVSIWQVSASACFYAIFAATPFIREAFGVSRFLVGITVTAIMLGYTTFLFVMGAAVDAYGEKPVMVAGLGALAIGAFGISVAWSYPSLLVVLFLVGATYATAMPGTNRAIVDSVPVARRNLAISLKQVGVTAGSGLSAVIVTGFAATQFGWRAGFQLAALAGVLTVFVFAVGYSGRGGTQALSTPNVRGLLADREYATLVAAGFFLGAAVFSTTGYTILYLHEDVGLAAGFAGLVLALVQVTGSVGRVVTGDLADRLPGSQTRGAALVLAAQAVCSGVFFVAVTRIRGETGALVGFGLLGFFILGFPGIYHSCLSGIVPEDKVGEATAGGQTALNAGALLAPPAFGYLADHLSYTVGWLFLAGCSAVATVLAVRLVSAPTARAS